MKKEAFILVPRILKTLAKLVLIVIEIFGAYLALD
jgi:hypothetical protein